MADEQPTAVAVFHQPRLPYHPAIEERFGVTPAAWKALVEAVYPAAKTSDSVVMALAYCKARNLDPFKRPVHIVPVWDSNKGAMVETVWPGISELRTTAMRTGLYAGCEEVQFGIDLTRDFKWHTQRGGDQEATVTFPEWAQMTVYRMVGGARVSVVGPRVYWLETYATVGKSDAPNEMWRKRPRGQIEKCAEAAALRRAFPEELGDEASAEEMEGAVFPRQDVHVPLTIPGKALTAGFGDDEGQGASVAGVHADPSQPVADAAAAAGAPAGGPEQAKSPEPEKPKRAARGKAADKPADPPAERQPDADAEIQDAEFEPIQHEEEKGAAEAESEARPTETGGVPAAEPQPATSGSATDASGASAEETSSQAQPAEEAGGGVTRTKSADVAATETRIQNEAVAAQVGAAMRAVIDAEAQEDEETAAPRGVVYRLFGQLTADGRVQLYENGKPHTVLRPGAAEKYPGFDRHPEEEAGPAADAGETMSSQPTSDGSPVREALGVYAAKVADATSWLSIKQHWRTLNRTEGFAELEPEQQRMARLLAWERNVVLWDSKQDRTDFTDDCVLFRFWLDTEAARDVDAINGNFSMLVRSQDYRNAPQEAKESLGRLVIEAKKAAGAT